MKAADALPSWLSGLLSLSGADLSSQLSENLSAAPAALSAALEAAIRPAAIGLLSFFITVIVFLVIFFLLSRFAARPILKLFDLPVIRTADRVLGALIGAVDAFLLVSLAAYLLRLLLPSVSSQAGWLNESTIYNSFIFYHFYSGNIFSAVTSWIGL